MKTPEDHAAHFRALYTNPQTRALLLIERAKAMVLDPPASPRDEKREKTPEAVAKARAKRAGLWAAKHPFLQDETITPLVAKALADGNVAEVLGTIAKGAKLADEDPSPSIFARHVIVAIRQAAHIMQSENRMPSKAEIRGAVNSVFDENGWPGFMTEPQRWTEIFNAADLSDMAEER